jgi:hypothetical protein
MAELSIAKSETFEPLVERRRTFITLSITIEKQDIRGSSDAAAEWRENVGEGSPRGGPG